MIQVIRKTKIDGEIYERRMSFSEKEWNLIQLHYPMDGVTFEIVTGVTKAKAGRETDDDKPKMKDYNDFKDAGVEHFKEGRWDKAIYYLEEARKLKNHGWLTGKINKAKKNAKIEEKAKGK